MNEEKPNAASPQGDVSLEVEVARGRSRDMEGVFFNKLFISIFCLSLPFFSDFILVS